MNVANLWNSVKSNPYFVAGYSAFLGAVASEIQDEITAGHLDFTRAGVHKMVGYALSVAVAAVVHLYQSKPTPKGPQS